MEIPRLNALDLKRTWKPGEPVEHVRRRGGPYGATETRPGVVVGIDEELRVVQFLRVRFDDGEERRINPDVMRHRIETP